MIATNIITQIHDSVLFQDNQKDLENATEQLSEYLERDITSEILVDIKQKVQDKYRLVLVWFSVP